METGNGFVLTDPQEIARFATLAGMGRVLLDKKLAGIKNACIAVGEGTLGVLNRKSMNWYVQHDVDNPDGSKASANQIVESFGLLKMAKAHKVDLVGVEVRCGS